MHFVPLMSWQALPAPTGPTARGALRAKLEADGWHDLAPNTTYGLTLEAGSLEMAEYDALVRYRQVECAVFEAHPGIRIAARVMVSERPSVDVKVVRPSIPTLRLQQILSIR